METPKQSSNARVAAILALVAAFVVIMVLIVSSLAGSDSGDDGANQAGQRQENNSKESKRSERKIYVVKPGDCCLSQIAEKTGIDVDVLVQLNPSLDPQAIHSGDRVKLR
jgi:LysM repeat protein